MEGFDLPSALAPDGCSLLYLNEIWYRFSRGFSWVSHWKDRSRSEDEVLWPRRRNYDVPPPLFFPCDPWMPNELDGGSVRT